MCFDKRDRVNEFRDGAVLCASASLFLISACNHNPHSSIFDLAETQVIESQFVRVMSWYDNEWGFSNRMIDTAKAMGNLL